MKIIINEGQIKEYVAIALINRGKGRVTPEKMVAHATTVTEETGEQRVISWSLEVEV